MRTIAVYMPAMEGGGAERIILRLIGYFLKSGFEVDLLLNRKKGILLEKIPPRVRVLELRPPFSFLRIWSLARYLKQAKPKVLLSLLEGPNFISGLIKGLRLADTRIVASVRNMDDKVIENYPVTLNKWMLTFFYPGVLRWTDKIIAVTRGVKEDYLVKKGGLPAEKIVVIHNPVALEEIRTAMEEPIVEEWYDAGTEPFLLGVGRLEPQKDFGTLLRAFSLMRDEWPGSLLILGEGKDRLKLEALIRELDLGKRVKMPGYVKNPWKFMRRAGVFVLSSVHEGFGNVLAEAMVCGLPIVSTDCPSGPAEVLENGKYGRLVPPGNPKALADAVLASLRGGGRINYGERLKSFDLDKAAQRYLEILGL